MPLLLEMKKITKSFSGVEVLHGVDFKLHTGEVMALMGENGAGKSTLMKILSGVHGDWSGEILLDGKTRLFSNTRDAEEAGIAIIYQELNLIQELSIAENMWLGREPAGLFGRIDYSEMYENSRRILEKLHFTPDVTVPVSRLRIGHQQLVEIGKSLTLNTRILIMDEPTSALSEPEIHILFQVIRRLQKRGVTVIFISHRISEVFRIADRVTVLRDGSLVDVRKTCHLDREQLIRMMVGREVRQFFMKSGNPTQEQTLRVRNLTRYSKYGKARPLLENISFDLDKGEVLGVGGLLGSGRTELLEALFGADPDHTAGDIFIRGERVCFRHPRDAIDAGIALITEDRKGNGLVLQMGMLHNISLASLESLKKGLFLSKEKERELADTFIPLLDIQTASLEEPVEFLSGGNQQKVLLAKWLATDPCILLLDEPTRGIDVGAKYQIYRFMAELTEKGISILMTSSELPELLSLCDRILVMREGTLSATFSASEVTQEAILNAAAPI
jgi:ABC-type sugar transport system ATPase subunit